MTEGTFPKVNGDILYASEVNDAILSKNIPNYSLSEEFNNELAAQYNATTFGSHYPTIKIIKNRSRKFDLLSGVFNNADFANSTITKIPLFPATTYDIVSGGTLAPGGGNRWLSGGTGTVNYTTGSGTNGTIDLVNDGTNSYVVSSGGNSINFNGSYTIFYYVRADADTYLQIQDDSAHAVTLTDTYNGKSGFGRVDIRSGTSYLNTENVTSIGTSTKNISSIVSTDPWRIKVYSVRGAGASSTSKLHYLKYLSGINPTAVTQTFVSDYYWISGGSVTNACIVANDVVPSGTSIAYYLSTNKGNTWTQTSNLTKTSLGVGSTIGMKAIMVSSGLNVPALYQYALYYNLW